MQRSLNPTDYLAIVFVLFIVFAVATPALLYQRQLSRMHMCENNLRQLGMGMLLHAQRDPRKRFCSGSYDWYRDGCPDRSSWVGNLIELGTGSPRALLCPENSVRGLATLNDLIGQNSQVAVGPESTAEPLRNAHRKGVKLEDVEGTFCHSFTTTFDDGSANPAGIFPNGPGRLGVVQNAVNSGYTTNYSASWFLARMTCRFTRVDSSLVSSSVASIFTYGDQRDQSGAYDGLLVRYAEKAFPATSSIPLLADAAPARGPGSVLSNTLSSSLQAGDVLGTAAGDGPVCLVPKATPPRLALLNHWSGYESLDACSEAWSIGETIFDDVLPLPDEEGFGGVDFGTPGDGKNERLNAPNTYGGKDNLLFLQDTRNFASAHRVWKTRYVVVVFADGSVKQVADENNDGVLNPGFPVDTSHGEATLQTSIGYTNMRCEVGPATMYNGPLLDMSFIRRTYCEF